MKKKILIFMLVLLVVTIYQIHSINKYVPQKYVVVIDPGHGGKDQGASRNNVYEEDINFQVALYLKQLLESQDITVILTRTTDKDLAKDTATNRKREDLKNRVLLMEDGDLFVSIHMNISLDTTVKGSQVYYGKDSEESKQFANIVQMKLKELNQSKFESKVGDYYILNETSTPGILVECGFLSNDIERKQLQDVAYQEQIAYAICVGILEYKNGK